jgi:hypothetical protein
MTDLEICKRLAEIEGYKTSITDATKGVWASIYKNDCYDWYSPLTDDSLCFKLIVKYKIDLDFTDDGYTRAWQYNHICGQDTLNKNPNKAICLAIIESHK